MPARQQPKLLQELPSAIQKKVKPLLRTVAAIYPEQIEDVIVSSSLSADDGGYGSIWFFTKHFIGEIHDPFSTEKLEFDIVPYTKRIDYLYVTADDFDMREAKTTSRFVVEFSTEDGNSGEIAAVGKDCLYLKSLLQKWFYPDLAVG